MVLDTVFISENVLIETVKPVLSLSLRLCGIVGLLNNKHHIVVGPHILHGRDHLGVLNPFLSRGLTVRSTKISVAGLLLGQRTEGTSFVLWQLVVTHASFLHG